MTGIFILNDKGIVIENRLDNPISGDMTLDEKAEFLKECHTKTMKFMHQGVIWGFWESFTENGVPIPFPIKVSLKDLPEKPFMSHVLVKAGVFTTISEARQRGFNQPATLGIHVVTKKKIRIEVLD